MTTVAWDGHTLAADKCSWGGGDCRRTVSKLFRFSDGIYATVGNFETSLAYAEWRIGKRNEMPDFSKYAVEKGNIIGVFISCEGKPHVVTSLGNLIPYEEKFFAWGAGDAFAWGALEAGASAVKAVEIAMKRSDGAGLGIDTMTLETS